MKYNQDDIEKIWKETPTHGILPKGTRKRMWQKIYQQTLKENPTFTYRAMAGVFLIAFLAAGAFYWTSTQNSAVKEMAVKTYSNDIRLLKLSDGSRIWINENTKISYPETFSEEERLVHLEGEAFFDIARDTTRPFKITTGKFTTTVLGTTFNIDAYDHQRPKVSVVSGKVRVEKNTHKEKNSAEAGAVVSKKVELIKGEATIYQDQQQNFDKIEVTPKEIAWKNPLLDIDNKNLQEVLTQLAREYHVNFNAPKDINYKAHTLKGTLDTRQSLSSSLKVISFALEEISFQQHGDTIWVKNKQQEKDKKMSE